MSGTDKPADTGATLPVHRVEALAHCIFAVAMTLLVIELKLPEAQALGEHGMLLAQIVYSANMAALSLTALLIVRYAYRHPEPGHGPLPEAHYRVACLRIGGLIVISAVAVTAIVPWSGSGSVALMLMAVIGQLSRRMARRWLTCQAAAKAVT